MEPSKTFLPYGPWAKLVEKRFLVQTTRSIAPPAWVIYPEGSDLRAINFIGQ